MPDESAPSLIYLWDRRTFFLGRLNAQLRMSQAAATLVVSLAGPLHFFCAGQRMSATSALLPAGVELEMQDGSELIAVCYLDPFGEDYQRLQGRFRLSGSPLLVDYAEEALLLAQLHELHQARATPEQVAQFLEQLIGQAPLPPEHRIDPRIVRTVALIKADVSSNLSAEYLAEQAGLSVPRLTQLFRETLGISMRRYRQWHRLFVTTCGVARGQSLTHAAIEAGFTDSAHFSHTFRSIIGMKPSEMLRQAGNMRLYAGQ
ncbi:AraC-like DNA-binding protein [Pseudomonas fluvialis]|uniref:AraC-like DNA-binding protein n=1 Tax=Pseudomonas fluvialis TaxID=1793966 RepID=A0A7X0BUS5_9PSED|nr:helix-turn-helix domain-containing protein [Pseudomonas fluvialis]MBB6343102.1 AraC-like DNA-binding protein [Pseudomonas fluvialis]